MVTAELVKKSHPSYAGVCDLAKRIYLEMLEVEPTSYPPEFISLFDHNNEPVAGLGILGGLEANEFLTEKYCAIEGVELSGIYAKKNIGGRDQLVEVCCLNVHRNYRKLYTGLLFSLALDYIHARRISLILFTQAKVLKRIFKNLNIPYKYFCSPSISRCSGALKDPAKWEKIYFNILQPECCCIEVGTAIKRHYRKKIQFPRLLPEYKLGPVLKGIIA